MPRRSGSAPSQCSTCRKLTINTCTSTLTKLNDIETLIIGRGRLVRLRLDHAPVILTRKMTFIRRPTERFMSDIEHRVVLVNGSVKSIVRSNHVLTSVKGQCKYLSLNRVLGTNSLVFESENKDNSEELFLMQDTFLRWTKTMVCNYDANGRHQFVRCRCYCFLGYQFSN